MRISKDNIDWIKRQIKKWEGRVRKGSLNDLSKILNVSRQTAATWYKKYKEGKLTPKTMPAPPNKYSNEYNQEIVTKYKTISEKLMERLGKAIHNPTILDFVLVNDVKCSKEHVRKVLINNDVLYARTERKTKRKIKSALKQKISKVKDQKLKNKLEAQLEILKEHRPLIKKQGIAGHTIEIDACNDLWVDKEKCHIYFAVDAFTNTLLSMWVEKEETTAGYIRLLKNLFNKHGLPYEIKADKRRTFWGSEHTMTHVGNMLNELGVKLSVSSTATFKPNVERSFENAQNTLPYFYMREDINTHQAMVENIDMAIDYYNDRYKYSMPEENSFIPCGSANLDDIMTLRTTRKVTNGNVVSLDGQWVAPYSNKGRMLLEPNSTIEILANEEGVSYSIIKNKKCIWKKADGLVSLEFEKFNKQMEFQKRKHRSVIRMMDKKGEWIIRKVKELQKNGVKIDEF